MILLNWLRGHDSNVRPPGYEPDELPTALPRGAKIQLFRYEASELVILFFSVKSKLKNDETNLLQKNNFVYQNVKQ